jgi:hypothetical protein
MRRKTKIYWGEDNKKRKYCRVIINRKKLYGKDNEKEGEDYCKDSKDEGETGSVEIMRKKEK